MLLSAALIVKNEERFLERCLRSIEDVADEVVVVDTGSTDATRDIAKSFGACLDEVAWTDDFAAARNHALDLARGDWILYIDADEWVRPPVPPSLRGQLANAAYGGLHVLLHPRPGFTAYPELRLFRNDPSIRFRGLMHERVWPDVKAYCMRVGARVGYSDLVLDHEGYEGDQQHKHVRNLPLLRKALREDPTRVFSWCHLATTHLALKRPRSAERAWRTALGIVRGKQDLQPDDSLPYVGLIQWKMASDKRADSLLSEALERFPRHVQLKWLQGRMLMADGDFESAIAVFEQIVAWGENGGYDQAIAYDMRLFNVLAYDSLATCHFRLRRYGESGRYFERALVYDPENREYQVKRELCERLRSASGPTPAQGGSR